MRTSAAVASLVLLVTACGEEADPGPTITEDDVLEALDTYETDFVRITQDYLDTAHPEAPGNVHIWVNPEFEDAFRSVEPASGDMFAPGMILIKEQFGNDDVLDARTVIAKFDEGFEPRSDDWIFTIQLASGDILAGPGYNAVCTDCHSQMGEVDYVIGVPSGNQTPTD